MALGRMPRGFWGVCCCVVLLGAGLAAGQEEEKCDPNKVPFDPPIDAGDVTPLVAVPTPPSCGDFQVTNLLVCQEDLPIKEGCCEQSCKDSISGVEAACLTDYVKAACDQGHTKPIEILDNLARRCNTAYTPLSCSESTPPPEETAPAEPEEAPTNFFGASSTPAEPAEPEEAPTNFFGASSAPAEPAEPEEAPTNFFGASSTPAEPAEPEEAPTNFFGSSSTPAATEDACIDEVVKADEEYDPSQLASLATLDVPQSCGAFQLSDLIVCGEELNIVEGCCQESCKEVLQPLSKECLTEVTRGVCQTQADALPVLQRVLVRCANNPFEGTCEDLAALGPASESTEDVEATLDGDVEDSESPTNFFGSSDSSSTPNTPAGEKQCTGDVDSNADILRISGVIADVNPQSCPSFQSSDIFNCQQDISLETSENNCCNPKCKEYIASLSPDCITEILKTTCEKDPDMHHIFQRTAARCVNTYSSQSCIDVKSAAIQHSLFTWALMGSLLLFAMLV